MLGRAAMLDPFCFRRFAADDCDDAQSWPSLEEVDCARREWDALTTGTPARHRYEPFHADNFDRIRRDAAAFHARAAAGDAPPTRRA